LQVFRERYPTVTVALHEMTMLEQTKALEDKEIDVGFLHSPVVSDNLEIETIFQETLVVVLSDEHPLADNEFISLDMLTNENFILSPQQMRLTWHDQLIYLCQQAGFIPQVAQQAIHIETIMGLVAAGMGITFSPASIAEWRRKGVAYVPLTGVNVKVDMVVAWRKDDVNSVVDAFLSVVREVYKKLDWNS
jgi:DNA-binding transcriptional LysR family regulator